MGTKTALQSKIVWAGLLSTLLAVLPIIAVFLKAVVPQWAVITDEALAMVTGILTVVWRIWFTNTTISTDPVTVTTPPAS
jgi:hypothetical protein